MINPATFICEPQKFNNKFLIYPPTVREVVKEPMYNLFIRLLTITQEDIQDDLTKKDKATETPTPFEFLLINCYHDKNFLEIAKKAFEFFLHEEVSFFFEEKMIVIGNLKKIV